MKKDEWTERIKHNCRAAGTYEPHFDDVIEALAGILANRDRAQEQFEATGGNPVVTHTNKGGNTNIVKNPALVMVNDLNATALAYWRDLGLSPKGFKQLGGEIAKPVEDAFGELLKGVLG